MASSLLAAPAQIVAENVLQTGTPAAAPSRFIASLDGLRAISILLVIIDHARPGMPVWLGSAPGVFFLGNGQLGVSVFFVISGFLITRLLMGEHDKTGNINLKRFYFRRCLRIFPAFYAYLLVLGLLWSQGLINETSQSFLRAGTYTWNYFGSGGFWFLGHTWSLSLEEQFYLLWPACLVFLPLRKCRNFALAVMLLSPLSRVASYYLLPSWRGHLGMMLHTRLDTIMFGCWMALLWDSERFNAAVQRFVRPWIVLPAALIALIADPLLFERFRGYYSLPLGISLEAICISLVLVYVVRQPQTLAGRFLNLPAVRHIGVISYGLYLWQQLFTPPGHGLFPLNLLAAFACAELSYRLVERPALQFRETLELKMEFRSATNTAAA